MSCLSRNEDVVEGLSDLNSNAIADACTAIRHFFETHGFREVILSPLDQHVVGHPAAFPPFEEGQLRFNTEPEVWKGWDGKTPFFSISYLFRKEAVYNLLRRPVFLVVDFYQESTNQDLVTRFSQLLQHLTRNKVIAALQDLAVVKTPYDRDIDGPEPSRRSKPYLAMTSGYRPDESFFEIDDHGSSTREELFLVSEQGFLELAGMGCVGRNTNPLYKIIKGAEDIARPTTLSGLGFGLERLLLCDQLLARGDGHDGSSQSGRASG
jgi:hypothetical protein